MERTVKFVKESNGDWFVNLPEWTGDKSELQMVMGADTLLDIMAQGHDEIVVYISTEGFPGGNVISKYQEGFDGDVSIGGAMYNLPQYRGIDFNLNLWLCDVTAFVFGEMPDHIYLNCISDV